MTLLLNYPCHRMLFSRADKWIVATLAPLAMLLVPPATLAMIATLIQAVTVARLTTVDLIAPMVLPVAHSNTQPQLG